MEHVGSETEHDMAAAKDNPQPLRLGAKKFPFPEAVFLASSRLPFVQMLFIVIN